MCSLLSECRKLIRGISSNKVKPSENIHSEIPPEAKIPFRTLDKLPYVENIQNISVQGSLPTLALASSTSQSVDGLYTTAEERVPAMQRAIVTPRKRKTLNQTTQTVMVHDPSPGEVVIRILYTGICCSVRKPEPNPQLTDFRE